jgi:hypothetical protein
LSVIFVMIVIFRFVSFLLKLLEPACIDEF